MRTSRWQLRVDLGKRWWLYAWTGSAVEPIHLAAGPFKSKEEARRARERLEEGG